MPLLAIAATLRDATVRPVVLLQRSSPVAELGVA
jgi:hypothetical protein